MKQVWSCGGGRQSIAIAVLILQGRLPKPDFALMSDTGKEKSSTWRYLEAHVYEPLKAIGVDLLRLDKTAFAYEHDGLFNKKGTLLIPAFTNESGETGKLSGFCSRWWKSDVIDNYLLRLHGIGRPHYCKWIGFSLNETTRAVRMMSGEEYGRGLIRFPLIFDVPLRVRDCEKLVEDFGFPKPEQSSCYICPNHSDPQWRDLKQNSPDEFMEACKVDRQIRERDPHAFLHKSCVPLDEADLSEPEDLFRAPCESGQCFV